MQLDKDLRTVESRIRRVFSTIVRRLISESSKQIHIEGSLFFYCI